MTTLGDALQATLALEAVEVSYVQAVAGIQVTENAYVCRADDVSHSQTRFVMPDSGMPAEGTTTESIAHHGALYTRGGEADEWVKLDLPRPAIGPLAFLTLVYGADLTRPVPPSTKPIEAEVLMARARERVPSDLGSMLDDLLSSNEIAPDGYFPEPSTVRLTIHHDPLHIAEVSLTIETDPTPATFALELHPTPRRRVDVPVAN